MTRIIEGRRGTAYTSPQAFIGALGGLETPERGRRNLHYLEGSLRGYTAKCGAITYDGDVRARFQEQDRVISEKKEKPVNKYPSKHM